MEALRGKVVLAAAEEAVAMVTMIAVIATMMSQVTALPIEAVLVAVAHLTRPVLAALVL
jgi:hypothetical protein